MSSETITRNDIVAILNKTIPGQGTDMSAQGVEDFIEDLNLAPSDYIKLSELGDYVIEQGTSGIWTYRKWNSGIAECWGMYSKSVSISANNHTAVSTIPNLPDIFNAEPIANVSGGGTSNSNIFTTYARCTLFNHSYAIDVWWRNMSSSAFSGNAWVYISVKGTWK